MRITLTSLLTLTFALNLHAESPLVVHEWGTFTSFQDEEGRSIGGINSDDEPVPAFVHRLLTMQSRPIQSGGKGIIPCNPEVTMRLETPVVYFYPPAGWAPKSVNVSVEFHGGWLTEFYPDGQNLAPGVPGPATPMGHLAADTVGRLSWSSLTLEDAGRGPETQATVWLAPRETKSSWVKATNGEEDKFLFYRGVGHVDAPIQLVRQGDRAAIEIHEQNPGSHFPAWWVRIKERGALAFRRVEKAGDLPTDFGTAEFDESNLQKLKDEMHGALVTAGLFPDEADALLNTWGVSYFKSPGLRLFYLCPRHEIDEVLPLTVSPNSEITRVLVGRIEVVTPEQRSLVAAIAGGTLASKVKLAELALEVRNRAEPQLDIFQQLGRFRSALLLDEQRHRPTQPLASFLKSTLGFRSL